MNQETQITRLRAAIKTKDGWWASIFSGPLANRLLEPIADMRAITPNHVTTFSLFIGILAAVCFWRGAYWSLVCGAILVQLSFVVDCMDGQLARYRQQFSKFGAWFDRISDRVKDFLYYFSLAMGFFLNHGDTFDFKWFAGVHAVYSLETWLVWPVAMIAFFVVFLIDYYVNQDMKLEISPKAQDLTTNESKSIGSIVLIKNILVKIMRFGIAVYRKIPMLRFNIGEQVLIISLFCLANAVFPLLLFVALLGSFYVVYWPLAKICGYTERK
jgi:hypothetical protein